MLEHIEDYLRGSASLQSDKYGAPTDKDLLISTIALFIKMARIDDNLCKEEIQSLFSTLNAQFELPNSEIGHLVEVAELLLANPDKHDELIATVRDHFQKEQKITVVGI